MHSFFDTENKRSLLLLPNEKVSNKAFASVVKLENSYRIYYAGKNHSNNDKYTIYMEESKNIDEIKYSKEIKIFDPIDANAKTQVWMPYVFIYKEKYYMIFTARSGDYNTENYIENIRLASSENGLNWKIIYDPILNPILDWEGLEVENWGIIKHGDYFYMNYESRGPSRMQINRSIGFARSNDLLKWERIEKIPILKKSEYCASFFKYKNSIFMIVPNNNTFRIYKAPNVESITQKSFIGFWNPYGNDNKQTYDSPEVITNNIYKEIRENSKFKIVFSTYIAEIGWITEFIEFENMNEFLSVISK
tara:strand:- start:1676 stop:2593 length:918 start_codon:yes stop_codon:yes gene_type:complete